MRELAIKLAGPQYLGETLVYLDDEPVKVLKNDYGKFVKYQTERDSVNIKVYRAIDVGGILWFITQLFFFLISIFGIFDVHRKERCMVIDFEADVELKDVNNIILQFNSPQQNARAIEIQSDLVSHEVSNSYVIDTAAKKTLKGLKIAKLLLTLAIIGIAIAVLLTSIGR